MSENQGYPEPEDSWLYHLAIIKDSARQQYPELPLVGGVSADLLDPDVFCIVLQDSTLIKMSQEHKQFYEKGPFMQGLREEIQALVEEATGKSAKKGSNIHTL